MIIRQFRLIIKTKALGEKANNSWTIAKLLKVPNLVAEKTLEQNKKYTMEELKKIYNQLLILDEKFKTTSSQEKILFTQMINSL